MADTGHGAPAAHVTQAAGAALWQSFADMGWLGLPFSQEDGGFGGGPMEIGLLMHAFGGRLVTQPFVSSVVVAGRLLVTLGSVTQRESLVPGLIGGSVRLGFAHSEPGVAGPWVPRRLRALRVAGASDASVGWCLAGVKQAVEDGHEPTHWLLTATDDDGQLRLFLVDAAALVDRQRHRLLHGGSGSDLSFDGLDVGAAELLGEVEGDAGHQTALHAALASGLMAQCWGAAGAMDMLVRQTAGYVSQRMQFGRPLSAFQAVKHKLAEMGTQSLEARACCELTAMRVSGGEGLIPLAQAAKSRVAAAAQVVSRHAIQLHGAMGVCEELPVAPAFRWLEAFQALWGRAGVHACALAEAQLDSSRYCTSATLRALS